MAHGSEHSSLEIEAKFEDLQISCTLEVEVEEVDKEERLWTAQLLPNFKALDISQICL
jgi:hypothetical protein